MPDQKPRDWKPEILRRLAPLKLSPEREQEIADEISQHLDDQYQDLLSAGHSPEAALQQSVDELESEDLLAHNLQAIESDLHRDPLPPGNALTTTNFLAGVLQDIRYAFRMMRNSPGFTAITVLTFALGIGANTAIFTMMNGLMLHALPVRDPGSLVEILHHGSDEPEPGFNGFTRDAYEAMRDGNHVLSEMIIASLNFCVVSGHGLEPQTVSVSNIGGNFFEALGVKPAVGRLIGEQDIKDSAPVAVVSYSFWKSHFSANPAVIGQKITADDKPFTIIGVTQRGFYGLSNQAKQDLWLPQYESPVDRSSVGFMVALLGRLKPGVSISQ